MLTSENLCCKKMAKRRKRKPRSRGVTQRVNQRQVTIVHVGDKKGKRAKKKRQKKTAGQSAAEAATAAISASMGRPVNLGMMDPQLQQVLNAHNMMQRQTLFSTPIGLSGATPAPVSALAKRYGLSAADLERGVSGPRQLPPPPPPPPPTDRKPSPGVPLTERMGQTREGAYPTLGGASGPLGIGELGDRVLRESPSKRLASGGESPSTDEIAQRTRQALRRARKQRGSAADQLRNV